MIEDLLLPFEVLVADGLELEEAVGVVLFVVLEGDPAGFPPGPLSPTCLACNSTKFQRCIMNNKRA